MDPATRIGPLILLHLYAILQLRMHAAHCSQLWLPVQKRTLTADAKLMQQSNRIRAKIARGHEFTLIFGNFR
jgi:hypothetical protein